jgi:hypothetical protein
MHRRSGLPPHRRSKDQLIASASIFHRHVVDGRPSAARVNGHHPIEAAAVLLTKKKNAPAEKGKIQFSLKK